MGVVARLMFVWRVEINGLGDQGSHHALQLEYE